MSYAILRYLQYLRMVLRFVQMSNRLNLFCVVAYYMVLLVHDFGRIPPGVTTTAKELSCSDVHLRRIKYHEHQRIEVI